MEHLNGESNTLIGRIWLGICYIGTIVSISQIQPFLTALGSIISMIAGIMAIRYYHKKSK